MTEFKLFVPGVPKPQGSKRVFAFKRKDGSLGTSAKESCEKLKPWRAVVALAAAEVWDRDPHEHGVRLELQFVFTRPKAHYRTGKNAHLLKDSAPTNHITMPDLDKLQRAVKDSLSGIIYKDDNRVCSLEGQKVYGDRPGVQIRAVFFSGPKPRL